MFQNKSNNLTPRPQRALSTASTSSTTSPRNSFASSSTRLTGVLTATTTFSSIEEDPTKTAASYLSDSFVEGDDFGIVDNLDYEDVDDGLIDHEYMHRNRETVIERLITSEQAYTESLELVMKVFLQPLRKDAKQSTFNFLGMKKMVCTEREFRWLFGNFEEIVELHRTILSSLQERLRIWGPTQIISDVFQTWFPNFECYRVYLKNYAVALTTYERLTRYQPFKKFIDTAHKEKALRGSSLLSLLQLPAGCIDRYTDIITQLTAATPPMHPDFAGLNKCKQWILQFKSGINDKLLDADNVDQVLMIHQALSGAPFSVRAERRLVLQGQLSRVELKTRSMGEERNYLLFTDLLVFVKPKQDGKQTVLQYKGHLGLERSRVRALSKEDTGGISHCIEITSSFSGVDNLNTTYIAAPTVHILYTGSDEECTEWLNKLEAVIDNLDKIALAKHAQATRRMVNSRAPRGSVASNPSLHPSNSSVGSGRTSSSYEGSFSSQ